LELSKTGGKIRYEEEIRLESEDQVCVRLKAINNENNDETR
jgi:hypothetical protein